jgi:elongation factor Ts
MPEFTAADVKKLRDATGAGMMDAKRALQEADGVFDDAIEVLRVKGQAKVAKRGAERTASNGLIAAAEGAMIEFGCETDFVAKNEAFQALAGDIVAHAAASGIGDADTLLGEVLKDGRTVRDNIDALGAVIGEKLELKRAVVLDGHVATYLHRKASDLPPQLGVLVQFTGDDPEAARLAAMQVASMKPSYVTRDEVSPEAIETEKRVAEAKAREGGKPEAALARIVEGSLNAFYKDNVLNEQESIQDNKRTVQAVLADAGVNVTRFARFEVGEV